MTRVRVAVSETALLPLGGRATGNLVVGSGAVGEETD
jgi:hypothetical protein